MPHFGKLSYDIAFGNHKFQKVTSMGGSGQRQNRKKKMSLKGGNKENERPGAGWASHVGVDIVKNDAAQAGRAFYKTKVY